MNLELCLVQEAREFVKFCFKVNMVVYLVNLCLVLYRRAESSFNI